MPAFLCERKKPKEAYTNFKVKFSRRKRFRNRVIAERFTADLKWHAFVVHGSTCISMVFCLVLAIRSYRLVS